MCSTNQPTANQSTTNQATGDLGLTDKNSCACGTVNHSPAVDQAADGLLREDDLVEGMTCSHCVASVTEEVSAVDGVDSVSVNLNVGGASRIMVVSSKPVPLDDIHAAVTEAGYSLVTAQP